LKVLEKGEDGWRLVALDANTYDGWAPTACQKFQRSMTYQISSMVLILANAIIASTLVHRHDGHDEQRKLYYYYIEVSWWLWPNLRGTSRFSVASRYFSTLNAYSKYGVLVGIATSKGGCTSSN